MVRLRALAALVLLAACTTAAPPRPAAVVAPAPPSPRPDLLVAGARALRAEGDLAGAREMLEVAHRAAPGDDAVRLALADLLVAEGREIERAAALLAGVQGRDARWHLLDARIAEVRGDDARAELAYARVLVAADDPDLRLSRALALERLGRVAEATAELEHVRAVRPDHSLVRTKLAERYESAGRIAEAEAELRTITEWQPDRSAAWERLARFYERNGRPQEARAALARMRETGGGRDGRVLRPLPPSRQ